jgi:predicted RNA-binding Zn-ribbon protein involved in translation (DUF1610 family)
MSTTRSSASLGRCPDCRAEIHGVDVLIEYERSDEERAVYAGCPGCGEVVHPDPA